MEKLLRNDFTIHYGLPISGTPNFCINTIAQYFEIEDDLNKETILFFNTGYGTARYQNDNALNIEIINYDKFITGLPASFQQNRDRCDLIVHTIENKQCFLLGELTNTLPKYVQPYVNTQGQNIGKLAKAKNQFIQSLSDILNVPSIRTFVMTFTKKHCCFFNKQPNPPNNINAITAFNRLNGIAPNGLKMSNASIEAFGFEFWEFSGTQVYIL
jgi:hypothetical protein